MSCIQHIPVRRFYVTFWFFHMIFPLLLWFCQLVQGVLHVRFSCLTFLFSRIERLELFDEFEEWHMMQASLKPFLVMRKAWASGFSFFVSRLFPAQTKINSSYISNNFWSLFNWMFFRSITVWLMQSVIPWYVYFLVKFALIFSVMIPC